METDFYELVKKKVSVYGASISGNGKIFAVICSDKFIRIFDFVRGKLIKVIDESDKKNTEI